MSGGTKHQQALPLVIQAVTERFPGSLLWPNNSGAGMIRERWVRYGLPPGGGGADLLGVTGWGGFLAVEVKTGAAQLSKKQKDFRRLVTEGRPQALHILAIVEEQEVKMVITHGVGSRQELTLPKKGRK